MKIVRIILFILILVGISLLLTQKYWVHRVVNYIIESELEETVSDGKSGYKWSGIISVVRTDCIFDGICSVTVGGREVVINSGMTLEAQKDVGEIKGGLSIGDLQKYVGDEANVYATKVGDKYTIYGSKDYYIEVVR